MKKLLLVATLLTMMSQSFAAVGVLLAAGGGDASIGLGGLSTTTTTSVYASPLAGLVVFLDGEAQINLASSEAQDLIDSANDAIEAGEELTEDEAAILAFEASAAE
jgi:hypothetical protein